MDKQIANLMKQNEGMETSFRNKNIAFNKLSLDNNMESNMKFNFLKNYNEYLKGISVANKPPPQEKLKQQPKLEESKSKNDDDEDDVPKEIKPVYSTITNMEDIKRAFFSKEYETAYLLIKQHPLKFYKVNYKFSSDNTGRPSYVAKNLLRGFVQGLDDYRKYLLVCFRCILVDKNTNEYKYPSYWIVNTNDDLKIILGNRYDDYDFIALEDDKAINNMLKKMEKNEDDNDESFIGEAYIH